jgi:hypothetical protein
MKLLMCLIYIVGWVGPGLSAGEIEHTASVARLGERLEEKQTAAYEATGIFRGAS